MYTSRYNKNDHFNYKSPAYRLFHFRYRCEYPRLAIFTDEEIRTQGYHVSGDPDYDRLIDQQYTLGDLKPTEMVEMTMNGFPVMIVENDDACRIYGDIIRHLSNWLEEANNPWFREKCPLEDLRAFEMIAEALYPYAARTNMEEVSRGTSLAEMVANIRNTKRGVITPKKETILAPYRPIVPEIERILMTGQSGFVDDMFRSARL